MLGVARAAGPVARLRLNHAAIPLLQRCRTYCQAVAQRTASSDQRREIFVEKENALEEVLESCAKAEVIALDTEFVTFPYIVPKLQLVQVATPDLLAVIDYRGVKNEGMQRFARIMEQKTVVAHGAETDMRLLGHVTGRLPKALFDTQTASAFVGKGQYLGLSDMLHDLLGVVIDKKLTLTDWSFRPLNKAQISYAIEDVRYLLEVREILEKQLIEHGRLGWFLEEMTQCSTFEFYETTAPEDLWRKCKKPHRLEGQELAVLAELFVFRDEMAREANKMHHIILRDEALVMLATQQPTRLHELSTIQLIPKMSLDLYGMEIIRRIKKARQLPESQWPTRNPSDRNLEHHEGALQHMLNAQIRYVTESSRIAGTLFLRDNGDLRRLVMTPVDQWDTLNHPLLRGWRREVVGNDLEALKRGTKCMMYNEKEKRIELHDRDMKAP